jgi:hypothetical protein
VAACTAVVPTLLAAQGMILVGTGVLHLPAAFAVVLAGFLELALISSALLARAAAMDGRPTAADAAAVWVFSAVSGVFSATHELIGQGGWQFGPTNLLAAGVRIAAPLVAAWLWERVLVSARLDAAARTATEVRRDRRLLSFARAAQRLERLEASGSASVAQVRRALGRADAKHVALLRRAPATDAAIRTDIQTWLAAFGCTGARYLEWTALPPRPTLRGPRAPKPIVERAPIAPRSAPESAPTAPRSAAVRAQSDSDGMRMRFDELTRAGAKINAAKMHAEVGATCNLATSRKWVASWVAERSEQADNEAPPHQEEHTPFLSSVR